MCPGIPCCNLPSCGPVWVSSNGPHTDWIHTGRAHHFHGHENRTASGRVVHTHEASTGGCVNMRYELAGNRQQWVIDATSGPSPQPAIPISGRPLPPMVPVSMAVPALTPVSTCTHTHHHRPSNMCTPVANFCSWIKPDASKRAADAQAANARALAEAHAAKVKATAEALAAKAKRDAAAKEVAAAKANYEAILAKVHEGKEKDEWARYWADLERYYRDIGHQAEAKAVSENRVGAFNLNNFWGYPKP